MGNLCTASTLKQEEEERKKNNRISRDLRVALTNDRDRIKLLLLGTGDSGKTTIRKQLKNIYGEDDFDEIHRRVYSPAIIGNIIEGLMIVLNNEPLLDRKYQEVLKKVPADSNYFTPDVANTIIELVNREEFKTCLKEKRSQLHIQDCWEPFVNSLIQDYPNWCGSASWVPTVGECISVRVRTTGIVEDRLTIEGIHFAIFDVGGQRAERRKWIHCFDGVTAVFFVTSTSEYDMNLFEDTTKNRLIEALELFDEISHSKFFDGVPIILFLNKKDLFEQKFITREIPLNISGKFPTAPDTKDVKLALDWIASQFLAKCEKSKRKVYVHQTTATDKTNVSKVFEASKDIILRTNLHDSGFMMKDD